MSHPRRVNEFEPSQPVSPFDAVSSKIATIDRKDLVKILGFGHGDERSVCQVHWMICILLHQYKGAVQRFRIEKPQREAAIGDEMNEIRSAVATRAKQVECFGQNRYGCSEGLEDGLQDVDTRSMRIVSGIEQRDEGPRIEQDHLPCLRAIAALMATLASLAAARACPPRTKIEPSKHFIWRALCRGVLSLLFVGDQAALEYFGNRQSRRPGE